jgi:hypothetical protein
VWCACVVCLCGVVCVCLCGVWCVVCGVWCVVCGVRVVWVWFALLFVLHWVELLDTLVVVSKGSSSTHTRMTNGTTDAVQI